ncbi:MAG TPA: hypothetical protein VG722_08535, partial [Tepidisphaeraceae bacterium]|nr:hypothetical protein [Tepidisphaeraceae bacterium]
DRDQMEVFCYANQPVEDEITHRLRSLADHWRNIFRESHDAAADLIQRDKIDILVDLSSHTNANRLLVFARKPAPVQGTYLGYASTTGLRAIDFRLTDAWVDPPGMSESHHTEQLVRLPNTQWVYRPPTSAPEITPLPAESNGHMTFGIAANLSKINVVTIEMWSRTLRAAPGSILFLKGTGLDDPPTRQHFVNEFAGRGIGESRLRLESSSPLAEYFQWFEQVDLILDTFPFAGGTTSCHSLYMGVPVITRTGDTSVSRVGSSILHNLRLGELVADTPEMFVKIATELADDLPRLSQLRQSLRDRMKASPIMDEVRFVANLESAYRALWRAWCERV